MCKCCFKPLDNKPYKKTWASNPRNPIPIGNVHIQFIIFYINLQQEFGFMQLYLGLYSPLSLYFHLVEFTMQLVFYLCHESFNFAAIHGWLFQINVIRTKIMTMYLNQWAIIDQPLSCWINWFDTPTGDCHPIRLCRFPKKFRKWMANSANANLMAEAIGSGSILPERQSKFFFSKPRFKTTNCFTLLFQNLDTQALLLLSCQNLPSKMYANILIL